MITTNGTILDRMPKAITAKKAGRSPTGGISNAQIRRFLRTTFNYI